MGNRKEEARKALGMPIQTARTKLQKNLLFELLQRTGLNVCPRCSKPINHPENLSIEHHSDWLSDPDSFWNLNNVFFSHTDCEKEDAMVEVIILDERNYQLPTYKKDGKVYVVGKKGSRYKIRVRNTTGNRIEAVASVDGRDVISGEVGDYKENEGYVIGGYRSYEIEGWRENMNEVAAFEFSSKEGGYSSKLGTEENTGVIGVAIFKEKPVHIPWIRTFSTPCYPRSPFITERTWDVWVGGMAEPTSGLGYHMPSCGPVLSCSNVTYGASAGDVSGSDLVCDSESIPEQDIGTGYGDTRTSKIPNVSFDRENPQTPDEVVVIYYDSEEVLRAKGIIPMEPKKPEEPKPFPNSQRRFCQRPPK